MSVSGLKAQVIFSQNFDDPAKTTPAQYVGSSTTADDTQFTGLESANTTNKVLIVDGKVRFNKTINGNMAFTRNKDLSGAPDFVKFSADVAVSGNTAEVAAAASLNVATSFNNGTTAPGATSVFGRITLYIGATDGVFSFVPVGNAAAPAPEYQFSGTQRLSWFLNRTGAEGTYIGPDNKVYALSNNTSDTWLGMVRLPSLTAYPARDATKTIRQFKFVITAGVANVDFDNFEVTKLPATVPEGSLKINSDSVATRKSNVTLALTTKNATEMRFSNDGTTWTAYEPVATTKEWTLTAGEGNKTVYLQVKDASGAQSGAAISDAIAFDITAPAAPSTPDLLASTDSGPSDSDNVTNFVNPIFQGSAEPGATVRLYGGATELGSVVADASTGAWQITTSTLGNGPLPVTAKATDPAGNVSAASAVLPLVIRLGPSVELTSSAGATTNAPFTVNFTFTEPVTGFDLSDIALTNGTASAFTSLSSSAFTILVTPAADGAVTVSVPADGVQNALGNGNAVSDLLTVNYDTQRPGLTVSVPGATTVKAPLTVTFTFSEAVSGFDLADLVLTNATASAFTIKSASSYTALITPTNQGDFTFKVADNGASDLAGNKSVGSTVISRTFDSLAPAGYGIVFGNSKIDGISVTRTILRITGAEVGATYKYTITSSNGGPAVTKTAVATTADFELNNLDVSGLLDGTLTATLYLQDAVGNKGENVTATVEKYIADIVSVATQTTVEVPTRTSFTLLPLPAEVEVTYETGVKGTSPVKWSNTGYNGFMSGTYTLSGTLLDSAVTNTDGVKAQIVVKVKPDLRFVNTFTPNGDGSYDTWVLPDLAFYKKVSIEVFDRDGVRLFHTTNPAMGWDGKNQHGKVLNGSYFYVIQVLDISLVKKGVVTIVKE